MKRPLLLCTDLDRTLIPNGSEAESPGARAAFARLVEQPLTTLVYVTGRDQARVAAAIAEWGLPQPSWVIGDVGTSIFDVRGGRWHRWARWDDEIAPAWAGRTHAHLAAALVDLKILTAQPPDRQGRHKVSFYFDQKADPAALDRLITRRLDALGARTRRVWSHDETAGQGLLDVLPLSASKRHAIERLREHLGIRAEDVVFAGDSGNDLEVLTSPLPAVLVANAPEAVREAARAGAESNGWPDHLYLAQGGFQGMNGCYAAGILEGVAHFRPGRLGRPTRVVP